MKIIIEISEKNREDFARTYSLPNDENLEQSAADLLSREIYNQMKVKITADSEAEIKAIIDTKILPIDVKPGTDAK